MTLSLTPLLISFLQPSPWLYFCNLKKKSTELVRWRGQKYSLTGDKIILRCTERAAYQLESFFQTGTEGLFHYQPSLWESILNEQKHFSPPVGCYQSKSLVHLFLFTKINRSGSFSCFAEWYVDINLEQTVTLFSNTELSSE